MKKRILICGAGSIGIYLGAILFSKGYEVELFGKRKLKEVSDFINIEGKVFKMPEKVFKLPKEEKYDFVFITSKLYDFSNIIQLIKKHKIQAKVFAAIQNGLMDLVEFEKSLETKIIPICVFSGFRLEKGKIYVSSTSVGWKTNTSENGKNIQKLLSNSGINCSTEKNLDSIRAEKTIINSTLNALSAIEKKSFKELFENKRTRKEIDLLFSESYDILKKKYPLTEKEKMKKNLYKNWAKLNHFSSTYQDLTSGRKIETKFFNGYIVCLGKKCNLPVENNQKIIKEINLLKIK